MKQYLQFWYWKKKLQFKKVSNIDNNIQRFFIDRLLNVNVQLNIRKQPKNCYKSIRKHLGFPVRGQRTRSNAKTAKKRLWRKN